MLHLACHVSIQAAKKQPAAVLCATCHASTTCLLIAPNTQTFLTRHVAFRSSAVDIYDQKEKADWKTLCVNPDAAVQKEQTQHSEVVLDVELGPIDSKARRIKAAAVQLPQVSGQDTTASPAATPAAARTAAPVQKQIQADCNSWHAHAEQLIVSLQHDDEHSTSGLQNSAASQQQPSFSQGFVEEELKALQKAAAVNVICVESQMTARAAEGASQLKRIVIEYLFGGMCVIAGTIPCQRVQTASVLKLEVPVYL